MPTNPPGDWPKISTAIFYEDPAAAISFLEKAFGFETRMKVEGPTGSIEHSELVCGDGLVMVAGVGERHPGLSCLSPKGTSGAVTAGLYMYVDDIDGHCERARAAGAEIVVEPTTKHYGDRNYEALDCEGHWWSFGERVDDDAWKKASKEENKA